MKTIFIHDIEVKLNVWPFHGAIVAIIEIKSGTGQEEVAQIDETIKEKHPELLDKNGKLKRNITYSLKAS